MLAGVHCDVFGRLAPASGALSQHGSPGVRRAEPFQPGAHLVSHLTAPHRALELASHTEHLVGGYPRGGKDHGGVFVGESPRESLHRVEGVLHVEVALEMNRRSLSRGDHAVEQAQVRPSLHSPLDPVDVADQLRRLIGRVALQGLAELGARASDSLHVVDGRAEIDRRIGNRPARARVRGDAGETRLPVGLHAQSQESPVAVRSNLDHAARGAPDRAKRLDLGEREIEARSRCGLEEALRLLSLAGAERGPDQGSRRQLARQHGEFTDARVLGHELPRSQILGDLGQGSLHDHGEPDGDLPLAVLGHGIGDDISPKETPALVGGNLQEILHLHGKRCLGGPRDARRRETGEKSENGKSEAAGPERAHHSVDYAVAPRSRTMNA